jgi:hypothetical protein
MDRIQIQSELRTDGQEVFLQALDEIVEGIMASFPGLGNHLVRVLLYHVGRPHLPRYREWNHTRPSGSANAMADPSTVNNKNNT